MKYQWAIVIFASRESLSTLIRTIQSALVSANCIARIEVLINGNDSLAEGTHKWLSDQAKGTTSSEIRVWKIPQAGKTNAWNMYMQYIWTRESLVFFIDGYVRLNSDSVSLLGNAVLESPDILGGTGVPSVGRSALKLRGQMIEHGGFHGNFCCVKGDVIAYIRKHNICLPSGLYRVDSYFGALLCFKFRPDIENWNRHRILVHPEASWKNDVMQWWHISDIFIHLKRLLRQSRGVLENAAVKNCFVNHKMVPEKLPRTAAELVMNWANENPLQLRKIVRQNWMTLLALKDFKKELKKTNIYQPPILLDKFVNIDLRAI